MMDTLWWRSVPDPAGLIQTIYETACENGCVAYAIPD